MIQAKMEQWPQGSPTLRYDQRPGEAATRQWRIRARDCLSQLAVRSIDSEDDTTRFFSCS